MNKLKFNKWLIWLVIISNVMFLYGAPEIVHRTILLLESGKNVLAKQEIDNIKEQNLKNYLYGIYYLYTGDYSQAESYINLVSTKTISDPDVSFYKYYIPQLNKIVSDGYQKFESEHFIVYLKGRDLILKDILFTELEKICDVYKNLLEFVPENKVRVEVYNTKQEFFFCSTLGEKIVEKTGVVGICKFNRIMILSPENLPFGYRWIDTLAHEYVHFILNHKTEFNLPLYLHEGIARYFDTLHRSTISLCFTPGNLNLLIEAKKNGKIIPFHSLKGSLVYLNSQEEIELAFVQLATFIDYLIKTYGKENFIQFVNSFKTVKDDILNYKKIYKSDFEKLYNNWLHFVDEKEEYVKQYPGAKHDIKFIKGDEENNLIGLDIQGYIHLGEKFYSQKNYKIALYEYQKALKLQPYNPVVMARIGKIYFLQKNFTESEKILLDCVTVNPNFVPAYETLINLYYDTGVYEKILQLYPVILSINPFNHKIRKIVAEVYTDLGKIEKAIYEYQLLKLLLPEDKEIDILLSSLEQYIEMKKGLKK